MKKPIIMICLIVTILLISACGGSTPQAQPNGNPPGGSTNQSGSTTGGVSKDNTTYLDISYSNAMSVSMQLLVGTLKLKGTENEVDAETAKELLPLWKAVKSLSSSDTTSSLEMDALYKQIQRTMSEEQIAAISDMKLTMSNMMELSQELGLSMGGRGMGAISEEQKATAEASQTSGGGASAGGGMMGGGPGGGMPGGGMMGGSPPGESTSNGTIEARSASRVSEVDSSLVEAVIEYLHTKIQ